MIANCMFRIAILCLLILSVVAYATPPEPGSKRVHYSMPNEAGSSCEVEPRNVEVEQVLGQLKERCLQGDSRLWQRLQDLVSNKQPSSKKPGLGISPYSSQQKNAIYYISNCQKTELPLIDLKGKVITKKQFKNLMQQTGLDVWLKQIHGQEIPLYIGKTEQRMSKRRTDHLSAARHQHNRILSQFLVDNKENAYDRAIIINAHPEQLMAIEHYLIETYKPSLNSVSGTQGRTTEAQYFYGEVGVDSLGPMSPPFISCLPSSLVPRSLKFQGDFE